MSGLLECRSVSRHFGGVVAVDDVSLELMPGHILGVLGPNGAGKSTLLNIVAGSMKPSSGSVFLDGVDVSGGPPQAMAARQVRRTYQVAAVFPRMTVMENLLLGVPRRAGDSMWSAIGLGRRWRADEKQDVADARELLKSFGLEKKEDEYAGNVSGGERRLVEILRATMGPARLLLLDEPMAGVNPRMMNVIEDYLLELKERGMTMMMVEHRMESMQRVCDSVVVMARGAIIASGSMLDVRRDKAVIGAYLVG